MRLVRFKRDDQNCPEYGVLLGQEIMPLAGDLFSKSRPTDPLLMLSSVRLLAPVEPPNVLCLGRKYRTYPGEANPKCPSEPLVFIKSNTAVTGLESIIHLPIVAPAEVYFEAELVVVIGRLARNVSKEDAARHVLGYTVGTDLGAKDCQAKNGQWARAKSFDGFAPLGPWIDTELDPSHLRLRSRLNGEPMQDASTDLMIFDVATTVSQLSHWMTLLPGTVIMMGFHGVLAELRHFLQAGDIFESEVEGIGTSRNTAANS